MIITNKTSWNVEHDPVALTFTQDKDRLINGVNLRFTRCNSDVRVQLRETQQGYPTDSVIADSTTEKAAVLVDGQPTRIAFTHPVALVADEDYAVVIMRGDIDVANIPLTPEVDFW